MEVIKDKNGLNVRHNNKLILPKNNYDYIEILKNGIFATVPSSDEKHDIYLFANYGTVVFTRKDVVLNEYQINFDTPWAFSVIKKYVDGNGNNREKFDYYTLIGTFIPFNNQTGKAEEYTPVQSGKKLIIFEHKNKDNYVLVDYKTGRIVFNFKRYLENNPDVMKNNTNQKIQELANRQRNTELFDLLLMFSFETDIPYGLKKPMLEFMGRMRKNPSENFDYLMEMSNFPSEILNSQDEHWLKAKKFIETNSNKINFQKPITEYRFIKNGNEGVDFIVCKQTYFVKPNKDTKLYHYANENSCDFATFDVEYVYNMREQSIVEQKIDNEDIDDLKF